MKKEHELKSLLTEQQFETSDNREILLAQARACASGYALATEGIAVVSDFQNNECHIYSGKFGQTIMNLPEYMVDRNWKIQCKLPPKTKRFCPLVLK